VTARSLLTWQSLNLTSASGVAQGRPVVACDWSTDRSLGLLLQVSPDATVRELVTVMKQMRPDLVRS